MGTDKKYSFHSVTEYKIKTDTMLNILFVCMLFLSASYADVYMHNPRGSNNRNDESGRERANANRLFDSQNNNRGGYNSGSQSGVLNTPMRFMVGSVLPIEWTNQHACGNVDEDGKEVIHNTHCELIIQYMCSPTLRDGVSTQTIPDNAGAANNQAFGMHENYQYYQSCKTRARNQGLFTADQNLNGNTAKYTRQNPNGQRRGFECPEERDYYPYWGPSPWKDIAVLTNDVSRCALYKKANPNVDCRKAPLSRDNHNGNGVGGFPNYYNWTIPNDVNDKCALRLRYNISTADMEWETDASMNAPPQKNNNNRNNNNNNNNNQRTSKVNVGAKMNLHPIVSYFGGYMLKNNPYVSAFMKAPQLQLALAVNTAQYGRTFQDRSHRFSIIPRPASIPANKPIYNLNVRGKRGNIVQVYPAVEYDFVPNRLEVDKDDYVHIQWTGSNRNPGNNDGEGRAGTDRSNMVLLRPQAFPEGTLGKAVPVALKKGQWGMNLPDCLCNSTFMDVSYAERNTLVVARNGGNTDNLLNNNSPYFNMAPKRVTGSPGTTYHYMSTRNNNFSNRSQKGRVVIKPAAAGDATETKRHVKDTGIKA